MLMFMLTVAGVLSIVAMVRSVTLVEHHMCEAVLLGSFGFASFLLTMILTNAVSP